MTPIGDPFDDGEFCRAARPRLRPGRRRAGTGDAGPGPAELPSDHCTPRRSTTKMSVSPPLMTPPAPRAP